MGGSAPHQKKIEKKCNYYFVQNFQFFFQKFSNLHERSGIGWIKRKTKFPIFVIFIFRVLVIFFTQNDPNFRWIFSHNSKNKKYKKWIISFFILFSTFGFFPLKDMQTPYPPSLSSGDRMRKIIEKFWFLFFELSSKNGVPWWHHKRH